MSGGYNPNAIFLMGPTGIGKSRVALSLAKIFPLEIVSVDSVQVYKDLNVGSAKPTPIERKEIAHHLIDVCDIDEAYSAARFCRDAKKVSCEILARKKLPLFVGGTGLYFKSFSDGLSNLPKSDPDLRVQLLLEMRMSGLSKLHDRLRTLDPKSADRIHSKDTQRVIRALEVCILGGKPMSAALEEKSRGDDILRPLKFVLFNAERDLLRARQKTRFIEMLNSGLVNEVLNLMSGRTSEDVPGCLKSVGYRQVWSYLKGELSYDEMVSRAIIATGQLAKRQDTWFRGETGGFRVESGNFKLLFAKIRREIEKADIFQYLS